LKSGCKGEVIKDFSDRDWELKRRLSFSGSGSELKSRFKDNSGLEVIIRSRIGVEKQV
jgi:hypothetical protein